MLSDGLFVNDRISIYEASELHERNDTYDIHSEAPGFFIIGDDSGGIFFFLKKGGNEESPVYFAETGMLDEPKLFANSLIEWVRSGFAHPEQEEEDPPSLVDICMLTPPKNGIKSLLEIKKALKLNTSMAELKKMSESLPAVIKAGEGFGRAAVLVARYQVASDDPCLALFPPDDHGKAIPIPESILAEQRS